MDKPFDKVTCTAHGGLVLKYQAGPDGRCFACTTFNRKPADFETKKPASRSH